MSCVYLTIPSKRPRAEAERCLAQWEAQGYGLAIFRDEGDEPVDCDILLTGKYPGYAAAVNALCRTVFERDADAQWVVIAGDDIEPDKNSTADQIAFECGRRFGEAWEQYRMEPVIWGGALGSGSGDARMPWSTFGVMQPTGDRWGEDPKLPNLHPMRGAYADRVCCSAFVGREFCQRMYCGEGPLWSGWQHMFVDEELFEVAVKIGVLWQRRDLIHLHRHWARESGKMPAFLAEANSPQHWSKYKRLFESRKAAGFPGHEPISHEDMLMLWGDPSLPKPQGVIHA